VNWQLLELSLSADDLPRVETLPRLAGVQAISLNDAAGAEILEPGTRLLDYGCGSGILAIAALRLRAATASAVDIDPQALLATRENADLNDAASQLWISLPDELPEAESDVLVANILAGPLQDLATRFRELVSPGGRIVLSGILAGQSRAIQDAYTGQLRPLRRATA
jgi:ribosomal protein L11 methyltransferase